MNYCMYMLYNVGSRCHRLEIVGGLKSALWKETNIQVGVP